MVALGTWLRYIETKFQYSCSVMEMSFRRGHITQRNELLDTIWRNFLHGRMTFLHWNKGEEMHPMISRQGGTLLVRKIPAPDPMRVRVGDVVVLKDPIDSANYLVRRLAAIEGWEMASTDETDESFVLEKNQCWVLADNEKLKPKEALDSRTFGPVTMADIVGRAIYCLNSAVEHGPVDNSVVSRSADSPVLEVELDLDEMAKNHKA